VSTGPPLVAASSRAFAHGAHLAALAGDDPALRGISTTYRRADARLRAQAGGPAAPTPEELQGVGTVSEAVDLETEPTLDATWFATRWDLGEGAAVEEHARRGVDEALALSCARSGLIRGPDGGPVVVLASAALGPEAIAGRTGAAVGIGPRVSGAAVLLEAVGSRLGPAVDAAIASLTSSLSPAARRLTVRQTAATALLRAGGDEMDPEALLGQVIHDLVGGGPPAAADLRARIAELELARILDQAPGEITRIADGLAGRRADRLHRAWIRGFFVPRGFDLDAWLATADPPRDLGAG
jgi:hypothetical protein